MTLESLEHFVQAASIVVVAGACSWWCREKVKLERNHYLFDWLGACVVWVIYYTLRGLELIKSPDFEAASSGDLWALMLNFIVDGTNTVLVLTTALSLSIPKRDLAAKAITFLVLELWLLAVIVVPGLLARFGDLAFADWAKANSIAMSFVSGVVLMILYHRLSRHTEMSILLAGVALWSLFGYAYLQPWFASAILQESSAGLERFVTRGAWGFKLVVTVVLFKAAASAPRDTVRAQEAQQADGWAALPPP